MGKMIVLHGEGFKRNTCVLEGYYFFIEGRCYTHLKWQSGNETFIEYPIEVCLEQAMFAWEEIKNVEELKQFLTYPKLIVRKAAKWHLKFMK